jgi:hypothetical protein
MKRIADWQLPIADFGVGFKTGLTRTRMQIGNWQSPIANRQ